MSWDLYLLPAEHADEAPEWLESIVDEPAERGAAAEHAAAIRARRPELEPFEAEEGVVADVVEALTRHTGWVAFDPQEDRVVDSTELHETFLGGHEHGVDLVREIAAPEPPRRRRFFGLFGG